MIDWTLIRGAAIYVGESGAKYFAESGNLYAYELCPCVQFGCGYYVPECPVPSHREGAKDDAIMGIKRRDRAYREKVEKLRAG